MSKLDLLPTHFISHGGGPWSFMDDETKLSYAALSTELKNIATKTKPSAVLVVSGHWEENQFTVMTSPKPPMIYDYGGFPDYTYHIQYPAPGLPVLAQHVRDLLQKRGIQCDENPTRGFDHGVYTPFNVMWPEANVPIVQLSMKKGYDPESHLEVGRVLSSLRAENVLIIGSGLSYHNLRLFGGPVARVASREFDQWLSDTMLNFKGKERSERLKNWAQAPSARSAHPREDHLVPLFVAVGAAEQDTAKRVYHETNFYNDLTVSNFEMN